MGVYGRILLVELGKPLAVPVRVPASWAREFITVSLCDTDGAPLAPALSGKGAFTAPDLVLRSFMARDVDANLTQRDGQPALLLATCPLGAVREPVTLTVR